MIKTLQMLNCFHADMKQNQLISTSNAKALFHINQYLFISDKCYENHIYKHFLTTIQNISSNQVLIKKIFCL